MRRSMRWNGRLWGAGGAMYGIKGSFLFKPLHSHPRFIALLRKMNLA
jgi:hypothetical protein